MFETVAPEVFGARARRAAYESLPVSVGVHVVAIAAFLIVPQWRAVFPDQPPRLVRSYSLEETPEPPPPPAPPSVARSATGSPASATAVASLPPPENLDVAPTTIPDEIPIVPMRAAALSLSAFVPVAAPAAPAGNGTPGASDAEGNGPAKPDALLGGVMIGDRVHFARNFNLPLFVERKRYPQYPEDARMLHREDDVTVRYVIGKDGAVKEVIVLEHPRWPKFEESAVSAIRTWKFRPFKVGDEIHEVVHELVVSFRLE